MKHQTQHSLTAWLDMDELQQSQPSKGLAVHGYRDNTTPQLGNQEAAGWRYQLPTPHDPAEAIRT